MFKDLLVFIFSFTLVIILFVFCILLGLRNFLTTENITKSLKESDFFVLFKDNNGNDTEIISSFKILLTQCNIPEEAVEDVVNSKETKEFIGIFVGNSIEATIKEKEMKPFNENDVVKLVEGNMKIIKENLNEKNIQLTNEMENEILELTKENAHILTEKMPTTKEIITITGNDKINEIISLSKLILSDKTKNTFLLILSVNILILVLLRLKHFRFLKTLSAPLIINFILMLILSLGLSEFISEFILSSSKTFESVFSGIIDSLFNLLFKYGIFSFLIALLLLFIYNIQRKVFAK